MEVATAKKGIDIAVGLGQRSACVSFFGGEPLLRFDDIKELTGYALRAGRRAGKEMHFRLATNGTLFNEEILKFCRDHGILFALSLDGDKIAHDGQRRYADGRGSFEVIDSKLDLILSHNPLTVVTSVITPASADRVAPSMDYLWGRGIRFFAHQLDLTHPDWTPQVLGRLEASYRKLAELYLARARAGDHFFMSLFDAKLKSHAQAPIELGDICDFGARKVSVAPDGRVFPCVQFVSDRAEAAEYCIGHVDTGLDQEKRQLWIDRNLEEREQCRGCAFVGRCTNFCACANWNTTDDITKVSGLMCAHEQMLIPIADDIGNQLWKEKNTTFLKRHYRNYLERFPYAFD